MEKEINTEMDGSIPTFVGIVLVDENKRIFLVKESDEYNISKERWNLPNATVKKNESNTEAVIRGTSEETGYEAITPSLLERYKCKKGSKSWFYLVYSGVPVKFAIEVTDADVKEGRWFTKEEFLDLDPSEIVHTDMKFVYKKAINGRYPKVVTTKFIDYDKG